MKVSFKLSPRYQFNVLFRYDFVYLQFCIMQLSRLAPFSVSTDLFARSNIFIFCMFHVNLSVITFIQNTCRFQSKTRVVDHIQIVKFQGDFVICHT